MGEIARLAGMAGRNREDVDLTLTSIRRAEKVEIKAGRGRGETIKRLRWARHSLARAIGKIDEAIQSLNGIGKEEQQ
ncbi:MAG: hypothetical protein ACM3US_09965 [Sphingomonadaceae bacterium]